MLAAFFVPAVILVPAAIFAPATIFITAANFVLAKIFVTAGNFVPAAIFVLAGKFAFLSTTMVMARRSVHLITPFLGKLEEAVNQYFVMGAQCLSG